MRSEEQGERPPPAVLVFSSSPALRGSMLLPRSWLPLPPHWPLQDLLHVLTGPQPRPRHFLLGQVFPALRLQDRAGCPLLVEAGRPRRRPFALGIGNATLHLGLPIRPWRPEPVLGLLVSPAVAQAWLMGGAREMFAWPVRQKGRNEDKHPGSWYQKIRSHGHQVGVALGNLVPQESPMYSRSPSSLPSEAQGH